MPNFSHNRQTLTLGAVTDHIKSKASFKISAKLAKDLLRTGRKKVKDDAKCIFNYAY